MNAMMNKRRVLQWYSLFFATDEGRSCLCIVVLLFLYDCELMTQDVHRRCRRDLDRNFIGIYISS